jgi:hypothetical protein
MQCLLFSLLLSLCPSLFLSPSLSLRGSKSQSPISCFIDRQRELSLTLVYKEALYTFWYTSASSPFKVYFIVHNMRLSLLIHCIYVGFWGTNLDLMKCQVRNVTQVVSETELLHLQSLSFVDKIAILSLQNFCRSLWKTSRIKPVFHYIYLPRDLEKCMHFSPFDESFRFCSFLH